MLINAGIYLAFFICFMAHQLLRVIQYQIIFICQSFHSSYLFDGISHLKGYLRLKLDSFIKGLTIFTMFD